MEKFGLAGLGNIRSRHEEAIKQVGGSIVATYDVDMSRNPTCQTYEELLSTDADWIVLLSPNKFHLDQVKQALAAGKKVITEKPAAMTLFDLEKYKNDKNVYVISQLRYMDSLNSLKKKVESETNGSEPVYNIMLDITAKRPPITLASWRGLESWSGGINCVLGIHYFDILTWIFGGLVSVDYIRWIHQWKVQGRFRLGSRTTVHFNLEITETNDNKKILTVNDEEIDLAWKFFELHGKCYEAIMNGQGIHPIDTKPAFEVINMIDSYKRIIINTTQKDELSL